MPVDFVCPHCGARTIVADEFVGQTGPCAGCGKNVRVEAPRPRQDSEGTGTTAAVVLIVAMALLFVLGCGFFLFGLF